MTVHAEVVSNALRTLGSPAPDLYADHTSSLVQSAGSAYGIMEYAPNFRWGVTISIKTQGVADVFQVLVNQVQLQLLENSESMDRAFETINSSERFTLAGLIRALDR